MNVDDGILYIHPRHTIFPLFCKPASVDPADERRPRLRHHAELWVVAAQDAEAAAGRAHGAAGGHQRGRHQGTRAGEVALHHDAGTTTCQGCQVGSFLGPKVTT